MPASNKVMIWAGAPVLLLTIIGVVFSTAPTPSTEPVPETTPVESEQTSSVTRVLLIGVTEYPNLKSASLSGPGNDVELVASLLKQRFKVPDKHITTLVDGDDDDRLPTFKNIEREFEAIAKNTQAGDQVLIMIAGHGSQQPDKDNDEIDGRDEVFLPRDTVIESGQNKGFKNSIPDDLLRKWLEAIRAKGAYVFFVADTCHSGTIARGDTDVARTFRLDRNDERPVSDNSRSAVQGKKNPSILEGPVSIGGLEQGGFVALYAAHPHELTYESAVVPGGRVHGWLSWAFCQVLTSNQAKLTYRELAQRIAWLYQQKRWNQTHPLLEGREGDLDREVLGFQEWPGRSRIRLTAAEGVAFKIDQGQLHGITVNSILAVYTDLAHGNVDGEMPVPTAFVKVRQTTPLSAIVEPVKYDAVEIPSTIPIPASARLVYKDLGEFRSRVKIDSTLITDGERQKAVTETVRQAAGQAQQRVGSLLLLAEDGDWPDWYIVANANGKTLNLVDADLMKRNSEGDLIPDWNLQNAVPIDDKLNDALFDAIARVTRHRRLRGLAGNDTETAIRLETSVERLVDPIKKTYEPLLVDKAIVRDGDLIRVNFSNRGVSSVDVTVLYLQSDYQIANFFPRGLEFNRLPPQGSHSLSIRINDETVGVEDILLIAVNSSGSPLPSSFGFLAQPGLKDLQTAVRTRGPADKAWESPLAKICRARLYADPTLGDVTHWSQRGGKVVELSSFVAHRVSWNIEK